MVWERQIEQAVESQRNKMRILLQRPLTGEYIFRSDSLRWTENLADAYEFADSFKAAQYCLRYELPRMQIVLRFDIAGSEIRLDLALHNTVRDTVGLDSAYAWS